MIVLWCTALLLLLAVAGFVIHAAVKNRAKRLRLAAVYDDADRMFRIQRGPSAAPPPIQPAPIVQRARAREPETDPELDW